MVERRLSSYELVRLLGEGGMARVYLARDVRLGREVAVKVLADHLAQRHGFRERFLREARLAAALDHPNIVPIYDYGEENALFLVMPYMSGGSLQQLVRQGPMDSARVATYGSQIADALAYAHQHNVVHRDVKPANILLHADGRLMLSDFGLAKIASGGPAVRRNRPDAGTPEYMAPEQIEGHSDPRADIYGLGVVLYLLLTGRLPFTGSTPGAVMEGHLTRLPERPRRINPAVTPAMEGVVLRALSKHPDDRYQSASEIGAALLAALVAGDAEPLPFLSDAGSSQVSLPPWLSGPSMPMTRSLPSFGPLPTLPTLSAVPDATAPGPEPATTQPTQPPATQLTAGGPVTTRVLPVMPAPPDGPGLPGSAILSPTRTASSASEGHATPASIPLSLVGSAPSLGGHPLASAHSGMGIDDQGWSQPIDRDEAQRAIADRIFPASAFPASPSLGSVGAPAPISRRLTPRLAPGTPPEAVAGAVATAEMTSAASGDVDTDIGETGTRLWPVLLLLFALLLLAVGALVAWVTLHPVFPH